MGAVTEQLQQIISDQINRHGIVVWYDPDEHYSNALDLLKLPAGTSIFRYQGSFFKLRYEFDSLIEIDQDARRGFTLPKILVYVPVARDDTSQALAEIESCGVVMRPGIQPPERNTALSYLARHALLPHISQERVDDIEREAEQGLYSLKDLDNIAERGEGLSTAQIALVFGMDNPAEVALRFLNDSSYDEKIVKRKAVAELAEMLGRYYGTDLPDSEPDAIRQALARHVLYTDFVLALDGTLPSTLANLPIADGTILQDNCLRLADMWRGMMQHQRTYADIAAEISEPLRIRQLELTIGQLHNSETFLDAEMLLQDMIESALIEKPTQDLVNLAIVRQSQFWASTEASVQSRWVLISTTGQLLLKADEIDRTLRQHSSLSPDDIIRSYTAGESPWCLLDTYHRRMERIKLDYFNTFAHSDALERLTIQGNKRYTAVAGELADLFVKVLQENSFGISDFSSQSRLFDESVAPLIPKGKTAYVLVDALRYEMAKDLVDNVMSDDFEVDIEPVIASVPTITEIGMASLMPGAYAGEVVQTGDSKLGLRIGNVTLKSRADRVSWLGEHIEGNFEPIDLEELRSRKTSVKRKLESADFVLVMSREIDELGEGSSPALARQTMEMVLRYLQEGIRFLKDSGFENIVVAADHGYIFLTDDLSEDRKIDAPGGDTADLHRRVWVGHGGATASSFMRAMVSDFGLSSDLELAVPYNFSCFKARGGGDNYFHGGLSPQELIVPQIMIRSVAVAQEVSSDIEWEIQPGSQTIGTITSVTIKGKSKQLFGIKPPKVRLEIRMDKTEISHPLAAGYNFEQSTGNVQLRLKDDNPNEIEQVTVTLRVDPGDKNQKTAYVILLDASTGVELSRSKNYEVTIFV